MLFNWGRATLGTVPFVTLGAHFGGVEGGMAGMAAGAAIFGIAAVITAYRACVARRDAARRPASSPRGPERHPGPAKRMARHPFMKWSYRARFITS